MSDTHNTAKTQFVETNGVRYAYRRFGSGTRPPLVCLQHFRGGLDNWDPMVTDGLSQGGPVILFNNAGIASSGGQPADNIGEMARHVTVFLVPTINSYILQQHLPNATLIIYPDSGHGAIFQFSELFVREAQFFLNS